MEFRSHMKVAVETLKTRRLGPSPFVKQRSDALSLASSQACRLNWKKMNQLNMKGF